MGLVAVGVGAPGDAVGGVVVASRAPFPGSVTPVRVPLAIVYRVVLPETSVTWLMLWRLWPL